MGEDISGLFNSELSQTISPLLMTNIESQRKNVDGADIKYNLDSGANEVKITPNNLPRMFDPRSTETIPEKEIPKWFYRTNILASPKWQSILTPSLDQAGCGSCWAFSTSSQFSDVIRFNLLRLYNGDACKKSIFFHPAIVCTGESKITSGESKITSGVTNKEEINLYGTEAYFDISAYFTIAFAPKVTVPDTSIKETNVDLKCNSILEEFKKTVEIAGYQPKLSADILASNYMGCMGCRGNLIVSPLMLFTGAAQSLGSPNGAPLSTDFTLHAWACVWGNEALRHKFCSERWLTGEIVSRLPKLYNANYYSYVTKKEYSKEKGLPSSIKKQGINNMTEWMMMSIYFYGPITIGYFVYNSFLRFYRNKDNAKKIYTARQFISDYKKGLNYKPLGGHAVVIVGWGEEKVKVPIEQKGEKVKVPIEQKGEKVKVPIEQKEEKVKVPIEQKEEKEVTIPYWVVRNSWGTKWADNGYCRVQRNMDDEIKAAGIDQEINFEAEFGALYFAPNPNPTLSIDDQGNPIVNYMEEYLMIEPSATCPAFGQNPELVSLMDKNCNCPCETIWDFESNTCKLTPHLTFSSSMYSESPEPMKSKKNAGAMVKSLEESNGDGENKEWNSNGENKEWNGNGENKEWNGDDKDKESNSDDESKKFNAIRLLIILLFIIVLLFITFFFLGFVCRSNNATIPLKLFHRA